MTKSCIGRQPDVRFHARARSSELRPLFQAAKKPSGIVGLVCMKVIDPEQRAFAALQLRGLAACDEAAGSFVQRMIRNKHSNY